MKSMLLAATFAALLKVTFFPNTSLLLWMVIAITFDLISGILKSYLLDQARTSRGFRQTVVKVSQYSLSIIGSMIMSNLADSKHMETASSILAMFGDGMVVFIIYIEVTSIFENLFAMNPESKLAQYFIKYVLNFLTFQIKNNPATKIPVPDEPAAKQ